MTKKYIFLDADGTLIDHDSNQIPESTKKAIKLAQNNGHEVLIATGRPPSLFYGIDKEINCTSYVASNGRIVVIDGELVHGETISREIVDKVLTYFEGLKLDVALEGMEKYVVHTKYTDLVEKFSHRFHIEVPVLFPNFHLDNDVYQMVLFYDQPDFKKFEEVFPDLAFNYSCEYGIDINLKGGMKDIGLKIILDKLNLDLKDIIAVGDGYNDISMIEFAGTGVAMGNASEEVKKHADIVTDSVENDGIYKLFKKLNLI
jgi:Cof subfamily protein (haloacid dehalogenase superfamily)